MNPPSCTNCEVVLSSQEVENKTCDTCKCSWRPKSQTKDEFPDIMDLYAGVAKRNKGMKESIKYLRSEFKNTKKPKL